MWRLGCEFTLRLVRSITHTGTRRFCLVTFWSLCFLANGLLLDTIPPQNPDNPGYLSSALPRTE